MSSVNFKTVDAQTHFASAKQAAAENPSNKGTYADNANQVKQLLSDYTTAGVGTQEKTAIARQLQSNLHTADEANQASGGANNADFANLWGQVNSTGDLYQTLDAGDTATAHNTGGSGIMGDINNAQTAVGTAAQPNPVTQDNYQTLRDHAFQLLDDYNSPSTSAADKSKIATELGTVLTSMRDVNNGLGHTNDADFAAVWGKVNNNAALKNILDPAS